VADDVEKTEKPTPKHRREARQRGQIAVSQEVMTLANLAAVSLALLAIGSHAAMQGAAAFQTLWMPRDTIDLPTAVALVRRAFASAIPVLGPVLAAAFLAALTAGLAQTQGALSPKKIKPKATKLNPITNVKRVMGTQALMQLGKSLLKLAIVGTTLFFVIRSHLEEYTGLSRLPLLPIVGFQLGTILQAYLAGCAALILIAIADYAFELWRTEKAMRMSRSEVKDEARQSEGDPHIRSRLRSLQMERARARMMEATATADVVVTNPEHLSVALAYKRAEMAAPTVVAKGRNVLAFRIREVAREHGVPIIENPPLARALYRSVKVGRSIPERFYKTVAELLAYVYRLDRSRSRPW
jgi:flagellar biosynthetic protein FlhB